MAGRKKSAESETFREEFREEIRVALAAAVLAFFFTQGLPLWDDDYSQWLAQANGNFLDLLGRVLLPYTTSPSTWGFSDRPVLVLLYFILSKFFGTWGTGYFLVKALCFGALAGTMYAWLRRRLGVETAVSRGAVLLFAVATPTIASLVQLSDFSVLSQLVLTFILLYSVANIEKGPTSLSVYRKGWDGVPVALRGFLLVFFFAVYFGSKLKGDVRLAPLILAAWMAIYRRDQLKVYAAPFGLTFLATIPWSTQFFKHLPPFVPGSTGYQGWTFAHFELTRVFEFVFVDMFTLRGPPLALLGASGLLVTAGALAFGAYRFYGERLKKPDATWGFFLVWLGVALLGCGTLGRMNPTFQLRYTVLLLVPATFLVALIAQQALSDLGRLRWLKPALVAALAVQCGFHLFNDYHHRMQVGHTLVAVDRIHSEMETNHGAAQFVYLPGFLPYGYKTATPSSAILSRQAIGSVDEISRFPAGNTFAASWGSTLDTRFTVALHASGCAGTLFDAIAPCSATDGATLLRYVGMPPEVTQALELEKQGNIAAARDRLEGYLARDPGNHGVAFALSVYAYRLKDYVRMEQIYDRIGAYFPAHSGVTYNWGLAKQGLQKYAEAAVFLERAYALAPKDYGIGFNLADAYYRQGRKSRALATLRELMQRYPDDPTMKSVHNEWSK